MNNSATDLQFLTKILKEKELELAHARKALEHEKDRQFYELQYKYVTSPYEADKNNGIDKEQLEKNKKNYVRLYKIELDKSIEKKHKRLGIEKKIKDISILKDKINKLNGPRTKSSKKNKEDEPEKKEPDKRFARDRFTMLDM